jgi:hypothetical protein
VTSILATSASSEAAEPYSVDNIVAYSETHSRPQVLHLRNLDWEGMSEISLS